MNTYVVLLRGVNVGGKNLLPMKELRTALESAGYRDVQSYIQSGNIVLDAKVQPADAIGSLIEAQFDVRCDVLAMTGEQLCAAAKENPFRSAAGNTVHFYFCKATPQLDAVKLSNIARASETYELRGDVFYLHAPDGIGRSKVVASVDACLGVSSTGRNLNTVNKIQDILAKRVS